MDTRTGLKVMEKRKSFAPAGIRIRDLYRSTTCFNIKTLSILCVSVSLVMDSKPVILTHRINWLVFVVERQVFRVMKEINF